MNSNDNINQSREEIFDKLEKFFKSETVVGEPIVIGDITIVPLISVTFGYGMGLGSGSVKEAEEGSGGGLGVGSRISPDALLVINKGEVSMMPIKQGIDFNKLLDKIPDLMDKVNINKDKDKREEEKEE